MWESIKTPKKLMLALGLDAVALLAGFIPYWVIVYTSWFPLIDPLHPGLIIYIVAILYLLVGFIIGEVKIAKIRQASSNWYGALSFQDRHSMRVARGLWLFGGFLGLVLGVIVNLLFKIVV